MTTIISMTIIVPWWKLGTKRKYDFCSRKAFEGGNRDNDNQNDGFMTKTTGITKIIENKIIVVSQNKHYTSPK